MLNFQSYINGDKPVVVDFLGEGNGSCKIMASVLKEVKNTTGDLVTVLKLDIEKNRLQADRFDIQLVPTTIIFKQGCVKFRKVGIATAHEILQHLAFLID